MEILYISKERRDLSSVHIEFRHLQTRHQTNSALVPTESAFLLQRTIVLSFVMKLVDSPLFAVYHPI